MFRNTASAFAAAMALGVTAFTAPVAAQSFPNKQVRITVSYGGGTAPDIVARLLAEKFREAWNQQVIVEGRPGGAGFIAMEAFKRYTPDGHELALLDTGPLAINPSLFKKIPYDPERDLAPVGLVFYAPFIVTVGGGSPINSVKELIAAARANPGKTSYATPGVGTVQHLGAAQLEFASNTPMLHVPFKDMGQLLSSVATGDATWTLTTVGSSMSFVQAKKLKLLAVATKSRLATHPDLPTVEESGGPAGYDVQSWIALFAPRGTPADVIGKVNQEIQKSLQAKDVRDRLQSLGLTPAGGTPAQLGQLLSNDIRRWGEVVKRTGASAD